MKATPGCYDKKDVWQSRKKMQTLQVKIEIVRHESKVF
jgi:hypothetical protein